MFDAYELQDATPSVKRFAGAVVAALAVMAAGALLLAVLSSERVVQAVKPKQVDVSFRPPPPPPAPARIENPPPPPPRRVASPPTAPVVATPTPAAAPAAAALVAPKALPQTAAPESDTAVQAVNVAVGGTGDGTGAAVGTPSDEDESAAPVVASAASSGPVNLPEDADPPEPSEDNAAPEYPEAARTTGLEARVVLKVVVERDGRVGRVQVLKGDEPFVSAAVAAVQSWTYEPARLDGEAIAVFKIVDLKFKLRSE
jgi:protein TonB